MDYYAITAGAIDYIERNLAEKITLDDVAAHVHVSLPHLYRIFPALAGCTIGQYIRRRRLSEAAARLREGAHTLDVALDYRFDSQEGFIRAFRAMFALTPGEYRRSSAALPLYHRLKLAKPCEGGLAMQPQITRKQFNLIGLECEIDLEGDFSDALTALTQALLRRVEEIPSPALPPHIVNMWYPKFEGSEELTEPATVFFTGVEEEPGAPLPAGFIGKRLPESLYAMFTEERRGTIGGPEGYAYKTWLPTSGYLLNEQIPGDLEEYPDLTHIGYTDACRIYIPICADGVTGKK